MVAVVRDRAAPGLCIFDGGVAVCRKVMPDPTAHGAVMRGGAAHAVLDGRLEELGGRSVPIHIGIARIPLHALVAHHVSWWHYDAAIHVGYVPAGPILHIEREQDVIGIERGEKRITVMHTRVRTEIMDSVRNSPYRAAEVWIDVRPAFRRRRETGVVGRRMNLRIIGTPAYGKTDWSQGCQVMRGRRTAGGNQRTSGS